MFSKAILAAVLAATAVECRRHGVGYFWQTPMVEARMDPIISPGATSAHVHTVMGGDGFSINMADNDALNSKCTGSNVVGDKSSYWFPKLYFQDPKTKQFEGVKFGFLKAYYFFESTDDKIKPFPPGFRMVSGNPFQRHDILQYPYNGNAQTLGNKETPEIHSVAWSCERSDGKLPYNHVTPHGTKATTEAPGFSKMVCDKNFGSYIHFPSCADLSKPFTDYANNMVYPTAVGGKQNCPPGYTHFPHLFLEIHWDERPFRGRWTEGVDQPFVLANGDQTGYGAHADFLAGWDTDVLQTLINTCGTRAEGVNNVGDGLDSCPNIANFNNPSSRPASCTVKPHIQENVQGPFAALPGCNPIQAGPQDAAVCDCSSGTPVCNGKAPATPGTGTGNGNTPTNGNGGGGTGTPVKSSSAAASATSNPPPPPPASTFTRVTTTPAASAPPATGTGSSGTQPPPSSGGSPNPSQPGNGTNPDDGDDDDDDDNTCDVPAYTSTVTIQPTVTVTQASPAPKIRRRNAQGQSKEHYRFHKRG